MNQSNSQAVQDVEVMEPGALEVMQRAEIDVQITTAKRYPRSLEKFKQRAVAMATVDEETAESCIYRRPVGKENGRQVFAEGMSVRMAEIVGASYGNLRVGAVLVEQSDRQVKARGMAIDLETNFASSSEVVESTVRRNGQVFDERMRAVVAKAALAKARRDATFQVVPKSLAKPVEKAVRQLLVGDAKSLEQRRRAAVGWVSKLGIIPHRVWAALGIQGESDITAEHLETLTGIKTAIKDGEVSIDEAFPDIQHVKEVTTNDEKAEAAAGLAPEPKEKPSSPQQELADAVIHGGYDFTTFQRWGLESGNVTNADALTGFDDIDQKTAARLLKAKNGLLQQLATIKGK